jgi:hypothetical protein
MGEHGSGCDTVDEDVGRDADTPSCTVSAVSVARHVKTGQAGAGRAEDIEAGLTFRAITFLIVSIYKGDGTALGYFVFMPKVHVLCMMLGVNSRVSIAKELHSSAGPYVRSFSKPKSGMLTK